MDADGRQYQERFYDLIESRMDGHDEKLDKVIEAVAPVPGLASQLPELTKRVERLEQKGQFDRGVRAVIGSIISLIGGLLGGELGKSVFEHWRR